MGSNDMPELGSKISLISKADIRYEGKLFTVDPQDCTIALANVRSFGTEDRVTEHPVPAQSQVYDYILFRATDIKDISVIPSPPVLFDPAIVQLSVPPSIGPGTGSRFQGGFQHPVLGQLAGATSDNATRPIGSGSQPGFNPMQSSVLNPLHQRSRQPSESQRHPGSVAELLGSSAAVGSGREAGNASRSSTPGLGRRIGGNNDNARDNQRQSPPRYDRENQRARHNSQGNSSNHEDRAYGARQYSQSKPREQHQQQPQGRFGNRGNMDNGFSKEPRNDRGFNSQRNDMPFQPRNNDMPFHRNNDMPFQNRNNDMYQNRNQNQQRRYQGTIGEQNIQRSNSRGTSGERGERDQRQNNMSGQRRPQQGWGQNNMQRQGMRPNYNNMRQNNQQRRRPFGGYNQGQPKPQQNKTPLKFDSDYDFDKANTEFEELRLSLAQVKLGEGGAGENQAAPGNQGENDKKDDSGNETAVGDPDNEEDNAYDKTKSFFDNISCEAIERSKGRSQRTDWRKELKLNTETFGVSLSRRFYVPRRGGYYNNNRGQNWNYKPRTPQQPSQQPQQIAAKV